MQGDLLLMAKG